MSANLDLVRSIYTDWERGDFASAEWAHSDIEWVNVEGPTPGRSTGPDGTAAAFRQWAAAWEDFRIEADEYRELDDERVLVLTRRSGRGKTSGLELDKLQTRGASVFHVCDGKVARLIHYYDRDRAFADLGLTPEAKAP